MVKERVFFSVIIPTYNRATVINLAIDSVLKQSFTNWEIIIVDDGSTDNTRDVILSFGDPRIKYFFKENEERSIARNYGIKQSIGVYVCFLDSDDIYFSNHLNSLYSEIENQNFSIGLFHTELVIKQKGKIIGVNWFRGYESERVTESLLKNMALYINAVFVSSELLKSFKFPEQFNYWEDQHLWIRILNSYPFFPVHSITTQWNVSSLSSVNTNYTHRTVNNIRNHLACIQDLQGNKVLWKNNILNYNLFENLKKSKASMYLGQSIKDGYFFLAFRQYLMSLKYIDFKEITSIYINLNKKRLNTFKIWKK